ncbi:MAG: hypothetical protein P4L40_07165 [Terracidiphilus sp.]|nr:hypothetical protein [Terracidiphilus sp.]
MNTPRVDLSFPHRWQAEILAARPLILPPRHFTYPATVEEVERGALEVLIQPAPDLEGRSPDAESFLTTCALGFHDPSVPTGLWSTPQPTVLCAVAGGYAYLIDTGAPERFTMLPYRPVFAVLPAVESGLLLFAGNRSILAWGAHGVAWESPKLSDEGLTLTGIEGDVLRGLGWEMITDKETPFVLDLRDGAILN